MSSRHEFISTFGFARGMWIHEEHSGGITYHIINENHYDDVEEDRSGPFLSSLSYRIFIHCTTNTHLGFVLFRWLNGLVLGVLFAFVLSYYHSSVHIGALYTVC